MKKDENGFIMIGIMLVMVSIWIMGFTLILISTSNAKLKIISKQSKQNFYTCEGAIEAVKAKLMEDVQKAIECGWIEVDRFMEEDYEDFIDMEKQKEFEGEGSIYIESSKDEDGRLNYSIDDEEIDEMLNEIFKNAYSGYFCNKNKKSFINGIEGVKVEGVKINLVDDLVVNEEKEIVFEVSSRRSYKHSDVIINVEVGVAVPGKDFGQIDYYESRSFLPAIMGFDIVAPNPVKLDGMDDIKVLMDESEISELENMMLWERKILSQKDGTIVYFGEDDIELDDSVRRGIVITRGNIITGKGEFEGMLVGLSGIECEDGFLFKKNRELVEKLIVLNSLERIFEMSKMDSNDYVVSIEKLERAKTHGTMDVESLINIRHWKRRQ